MELIIDTSDRNKVIVRVEKTEIIKQFENPRGQDILKMVEEALQAANIKKEELTNIKVNCGPGEFTNINVGVEVANALGKALNIPINENPPGQFVKPIYIPE